MESGKKQKLQTPAATGTSIVDELFGPKNGGASAAASSSAGYFGTVFPPPSAVIGKDVPGRAHGGKRSSPESSPYFGSTSVHYGGRDFYAVASSQQSRRQCPSSNAAADPPPRTTTTEEEDSKDIGSAVTRGDWWQGSLYY